VVAECSEKNCTPRVSPSVLIMGNNGLMAVKNGLIVVKNSTYLK
jgi:hypothetical protein